MAPNAREEFREPADCGEHFRFRYAPTLFKMCHGRAARFDTAVFRYMFLGDALVLSLGFDRPPEVLLFAHNAIFPGDFDQFCGKGIKGGVPAISSRPSTNTAYTAQ